jgi:hypothetical protein
LDANGILNETVCFLPASSGCTLPLTTSCGPKVAAADVANVLPNRLPKMGEYLISYEETE